MSVNYYLVSNDLIAFCSIIFEYSDLQMLTQQLRLSLCFTLCYYLVSNHLIAFCYIMFVHSDLQMLTQQLRFSLCFTLCYVVCFSLC
jgi:hypothetical protein